MNKNEVFIVHALLNEKMEDLFQFTLKPFILRIDQETYTFLINSNSKESHNGKVQWEKQFQLALCKCEENKKGERPIIIGLETFFPNIKNKIHFLETEFALNFTTLRNAKFDILCYIKVSETEILPLIIELKMTTSFNQDFIHQLIYYINGLEMAICSDGEEHALNKELQEQFQLLGCAQDDTINKQKNITLLAPVGLLLVPSISEKIRQNPHELKTMIQKFKKNIFIIEFCLESNHQNLLNSINTFEQNSQQNSNSLKLNSPNSNPRRGFDSEDFLNYYSLKQCIIKANELLIQDPKLKNILHLETCKALCKLDKNFPPFDQWCEYYNIPNLDEIFDWGEDE